MHDFLVNLVIGIVGGIYSSIIVSRIFLIREEYQEQLEILRKSFYHLGGITAFFDVIEIILKNMLDTSVEVQKDSDYIKTHNLKDGDSTIKALRKEILHKNIEEICANETSLVLKNFKSIEIFKFETIDKCKQEIDSLNENFKQCFKGRTKSFLILVVKDKILIVLFFIFLLICFLLIVI